MTHFSWFPSPLRGEGREGVTCQPILREGDSGDRDGALDVDSCVMSRAWIVSGAVSALVSVAAGAFGAHALKVRMSSELLAVFETGARYQMFHALALLATGILSLHAPSRAADFAAWSFLAGTLLFSGSLYALVLTGIRTFGAITPLGGVAFLAGWALLAYAGWQLRQG